MSDEAVEILLVEDNPNDRELTMRALRKHNLANRVVAVEDGEQALDYLFRRGRWEGADNSHLRVVFLDLKLPKIDGLEVLHRIRGNEATRLLPVVMVTSSDEESDRVRSYQEGVNSYVVKPIAFDAFVHTLSELGFYWLAVNRSTTEAGAL